MIKLLSCLKILLLMCLLGMAGLAHAACPPNSTASGGTCKSNAGYYYTAATNTVKKAAAGYYAAAGATEQTACTAGTHMPGTGGTGSWDCAPCPTNSTSSAGASTCTSLVG